MMELVVKSLKKSSETQIRLHSDPYRYVSFGRLMKMPDGIEVNGVEYSPLLELIL